jgi:hypothetical protein
MATDHFEDDIELDDEIAEEDDLDLVLDDDVDYEEDTDFDVQPEDGAAVEDEEEEEEENSEEDAAETADDEDEEEEVDDEDEDEEEEEEDEETLEVLLGPDSDATVSTSRSRSDDSGDAPPGEGEFTCRSCFLVKRRAQLADSTAMICLDCA